MIKLELMTEQDFNSGKFTFLEDIMLMLPGRAEPHEPDHWLDEQVRKQPNLNEIINENAPEGAVKYIFGTVEGIIHVSRGSIANYTINYYLERTYRERII